MAPAPDAAPTTPSASTTPSIAPRGVRRWRFSVISPIPPLFTLAGMLLSLYPSISMWIIQYNRFQIIAQYEDSVSGTDPSAAEQPALTHRYNDALSSGAILRVNSNVSTGDGTGGDTSLDYNIILVADNSKLMGRLRVPTANIDLPIYHGIDGETLLRDLGHLGGTSLPVGGQGQRTIVAGRRELVKTRMFTDLDKVQVRDTFTFGVLGEVLTHRVFDKKVVNPEETEVLHSRSGRDLAMLIAHTPLGTDTHHILVTGERVYPTSQRDIDAADAAPDTPGFSWWALGLLGGALPVGPCIWRSGYPPYPKRRPTLSK